MDLLGLVALFLVGATVVTKSVDWIRGWDKADKLDARVWIPVAIVIGIIYAVAAKQDLSAEAFSKIPALADLHVSAFVGEVITGIGFGAVADFPHKILAKWSVTGTSSTP